MRRRKKVYKESKIKIALKFLIGILEENGIWPHFQDRTSVFLKPTKPPIRCESRMQRLLGVRSIRSVALCQEAPG